MKLTVPIQLLPTHEQAAHLLATLRQMNAAATHAAQIGFAHRVFGQVSIHNLCYRELRQRFGLGAQHAVRAISKAVDAFARDRTICPEFRPDGAVPLDDRLYRLIGLQAASINTVAGRIKLPFVIGDYFTGMLSRKMGQADLVHRDGQFFLYITVEFEEPPPVQPQDWIGVDLGIVNIAVDSTGETFSGEKVQRNRRRRATARKQHQRKGTRNAKRKLKRMGGRQRRFQTAENHRISKQLVAKAKAQSAGIVLEDLSGLRGRVEDTVSRRFRRRFGNWGFFQLRRFVEYKARLAGVSVVTVDPRNTSRTCSACGHCEKANRPDQATFRCKHCGFSTNADFNAALNLRAKALGQTCKPASKVSALSQGQSPRL
ncbi:MAG: transposase [Gemmataceae bacterium]|nr:transposase [Gemmataceae bacterium]